MQERMAGADARAGEVLETVTRFVAEALGTPATAVTPQARLIELGAQSFDFVELVFRLERTYGIEMPRAFAMPDLHTIDAFVQAALSAIDAAARAGAVTDDADKCDDDAEPRA